MTQIKTVYEKVWVFTESEDGKIFDSKLFLDYGEMRMYADEQAKYYMDTYPINYDNGIYSSNYFKLSDTSLLSAIRQDEREKTIQKVVNICELDGAEDGYGEPYDFYTIDMDELKALKT